MASTLKLEIVTPEGVTYSEDVEMVTLPGSEGEMTVLSHHEPFITTLKAGTITVRELSDVAKEFTIDSGILEVNPEGATVIL